MIAITLVSLNIKAENNPKKVIEIISKEVFNTLKNDKEIINNKIELQKLIDDKLMPHIDVTYISLKILGKNYKKYKKSDVKLFVREMNPYMSKMFVSSFKFYTGQNIQIVYKKDKKTRNQRVKVIMSNLDNNNKTELVFFLKKNKKKKTWKIYDLIIEGVSLLSTKQNEFSPILNKGNMNNVLKIMNKNKK